MDEAVEAGLLVRALRRMPELIEDAKGEATGPIDPKSTRWKTLALELWGQDHDDDSGQQHVGPTIPLPPAFAAELMAVVKREIEVRLVQLGVTL